MTEQVWTYKRRYVTVRFSNVNTGETVEIELTRAFAEEFVHLLNRAGMEATIVD